MIEPAMLWVSGLLDTRSAAALEHVAAVDLLAAQVASAAGRSAELTIEAS